MAFALVSDSRARLLSVPADRAHAAVGVIVTLGDAGRRWRCARPTP
jgi:hypothetical protein